MPSEQQGNVSSMPTREFLTFVLGDETYALDIMTVKEIRGYEATTKIANAPDFIKGVKAPLPQINIMPTGGVSLDNVQEWFKNGVIAVGVGGKLASGKSDDITNTAIEFIKKIKEIKEVINNV